MPGALIIHDGHIALQDRDRAFRISIDQLKVRAGQAVALTGVSGSGKTLLLEVLGLLRAPGKGTVFEWDDAETGHRHDLAGLWAQGAGNAALARMRGRLFGFVPQTGGLVPFLSVAENIALPQRLNACHDPGWCRDLTARLGLSDVAAQMPDALSIGQRQRVAVARALSHRPPFVIADEPTAALDPDAADTVLALLLEAAAGQGAGVILSSHNPARMDRLGITRLSLTTHSGRNGLVVASLAENPC